jgi:Ca-activated chloride channel family protein
MRFKKSVCILTLILFYFPIIGWIWQDPVAKKDREARKFYTEGKIDEALSKWRDAQTESPDKKELHYNIGNALHEQKKYEDAFNEYEKSLDSKDAELQARSYYNMGNTHYRMGKLLEAIEDYKKCLDINLDDEDAKYNIEFIREKIKENMQKQEETQETQPQQQETQESQSEEEEKQKQQQETGDKGQEENQGQEKKESEAEDLEQKEGEMSKEDAVRLLDALKDDEKELQRELRTQPIEGGYRVDKDW